MSRSRLHKCCESTLRSVVETQRAHWPALGGADAERAFDEFFVKAAQQHVEPERASKRKRPATSICEAVP